MFFRTRKRAGGVRPLTAAVPITAGAVYNIPRLLGSSSTLSLIAGTDANLTLAGTVISATNGIDEGDSQVAVVREINGLLRAEYPITLTGFVAPVAPPPPPLFSSMPSIGTDGTPQVDEIVTLVRGAHNGPLGSFRLEKQNGGSWSNAVTVVLADAGIGSHKLTTLGDVLRIREEIGTTGIYGYSAEITVGAATTAGMNAPVLGDPPGYTAGTNPPETLLSVDETIDKAACKAEHFYDRNDSGPFSFDSSRRAVFGEAAADGIMGLFSGPTAQLNTFAGLAAGPFREIVRITNKVTGAAVLSNIRSMTLAAPTQTAATTTWDFGASNQYIRPSITGDLLESQGAEVGDEQVAVASAARTDERFWELTLLAAPDAPLIRPFWVGVVPAAGSMPQFGTPAGAVGALLGDYSANSDDDVGTVYTVRCSPRIGGVDGVLTIRKNGVQVFSAAVPLESYRAAWGPWQPIRARLNTGQVAFSHAPSGVLRYN